MNWAVVGKEAIQMAEAGSCVRLNGSCFALSIMRCPSNVLRRTTDPCEIWTQCHPMAWLYCHTTSSLEDHVT
jgi:hypothetical protein